MIKIIINHFHRVRYEAVNRIKYLKDQNSNATLNIRADFLLLQTVQLERTKHSKSRTNQRPSFWILCPPSKKKDSKITKAPSAWQEKENRNKRPNPVVCKNIAPLSPCKSKTIKKFESGFRCRLFVEKSGRRRRSVVPSLPMVREVIDNGRTIFARP